MTLQRPDAISSCVVRVSSDVTIPDGSGEARRVFWTMERFDGYMNVFGARKITFPSGDHVVVCSLSLDGDWSDFCVLEFVAEHDARLLAKARWSPDPRGFECHLEDRRTGASVATSRRPTEDDKRAYADAYRDNTGFSPFDELFFGRGVMGRPDLVEE